MGELVRDKIIIPLSECLPGMILLQPVVDEKTGTVLLPRGRRLTSKNIEKVDRFKHTQVWVDVNSEDKIWKTNEECLSVYKNYAIILKDIVYDYCKSGKLNISSLKQLAVSIVYGLHTDFDLLACVNLVKEMNEDDFTHSINVAFLSLLMGKWRSYDNDKLEKIVEAALLHDVGKLDLVEHLCSEENHLNLRERLAYKRHPIYGYEKLVKYNELDNEVLKAVLTHHERCDGSGFPLSLSEDKLNDIAKIISLADEYDDCRKKYPVFKVIKYLRSTQLRAFSVDLLLELCNNVMNYYIGTTVLLNTGEIGEIEAIRPQLVYRPLIKLKDKSIDLYIQNQIDIVKVF